ncbi:hypothetical protein Scep_005695 [Stephania cephalantha]|uniref:Chlorophyll synthase, chloroplastic n=1 Tax=Stephania cephalantha TaxID=152367 RepID=A0AAP0KV38_9MAGN
MLTSAVSDVSPIRSPSRRVPYHHRSSSIFRPVSFSPIKQIRIVRAAESEIGEGAEHARQVRDSATGGSSLNQLLGIKGAARETNKWKIRLQLTKPVTWPPLIWGVVCGAAASGNFHWNVEDVAKSIVCMVMSGPCLTGYTQTLNDWYDQEIDAINEPYRPIPSGVISENECIARIFLTDYGMKGISSLMKEVTVSGDAPGTLAATGGPRASCVFGCLGSSREMDGSEIMLWEWSGQILFGNLTTETVELTLMYSIAGLGIAIINDFKSIKGDTELGLQSLPVAFGIDTAKWISIGAIDITQIAVAGYLLGAGKPHFASILLGLVIPQVVFQFMYLLRDPVKYDVMYQACAQPFLVLGLLVTSLALSPQ